MYVFNIHSHLWLKDIVKFYKLWPSFIMKSCFLPKNVFCAFFFFCFGFVLFVDFFYYTMVSSQTKPFVGEKQPYTQMGHWVISTHRWLVVVVVFLPIGNFLLIPLSKKIFQPWPQQASGSWFSLQQASINHTD